MASKKKIEDMMDSLITDVTQADAMISAADMVAEVVNPPVKELPKPTVTADIDKLRMAAASRGGIKLSVVEGTEVLRNSNEKQPSINDGKNDVVNLKVDFFGFKGDK